VLRLTALPPEMPDEAQMPLQYVVPPTLTPVYPLLREGAETATLEQPEGALKAAM
jgi:hypothetical protein